MESSASSESGGENLGTVLESTLTLSRGLQTLYSEHEALLEAIGEDERDDECSTRAESSNRGMYYSS